MSPLARALVVVVLAARCAGDYESTETDGAPAAGAIAALYAPSVARGPDTVLRVGLGEAPGWQVLCPGRLSVEVEDAPSERARLRQGLALEASLAEPVTGGAERWSPALEVNATLDDERFGELLDFFRTLGYAPRLEIAGARFTDRREDQDHVVDRRRGLVVLGPGVERAEAEARCSRIELQYRRACRVVEDAPEPPRGTLRLATARGIEVTRTHAPVRLRCEAASGLYLRARHGAELGPRGAYRGALVLVPGRAGGLLVVNELGLEDYVAGVVPAEIFPSAPPAALEAQAVAARTYAVTALGQRHRGDPFDLCATSHCQHYGGASVATATTDRAVAATSGLVLTLGDDLVEAAYHASCGGHTERNEVAWPSRPPLPALRALVDFLPQPVPPPDLATDPAALGTYLLEPPPAFCARVGPPGHFRWTRALRTEELARLVDPGGELGPPRRLAPGARGASGRATVLVVEGERASRTIEGELAIRKALGDLPSSAFDVTTIPADPAVGPPKVFVLVGAGHGHGVGLCQFGAVGMAQAGHDRDAILAHYYAGARALPMLP